MENKKIKVNLNGLDQKIHIKGDPSKPILLFLHGGPGVCNRHMCTTYNQDLLDHFMVVGWDQRGTGGSYWGCNHKDLTIDMLVEDASALVNYLCKTYKKEKIFAIGGSWGSLLGTVLAHKHPEKLYAFFGFGQFVDGELNEKISYEFALEEAKKAGDQESVDKLVKLGPPVMACYKGGYDGMLIQREVMNKYGGYSKKNQSSSYTGGLAKAYLFSGEYAPSDVLGVLWGNRKVLENMWPEIGRVKLENDYTEFKIPFLIFDGCLDKNTPAELVEDFYQRIKAPYKELIWYKESGHNPLLDEPELFKANLVDRCTKILEGKI